MQLQALAINSEKGIQLLKIGSFQRSTVGVQKSPAFLIRGICCIAKLQLHLPAN